MKQAFAMKMNMRLIALILSSILFLQVLLAIGANRAYGAEAAPDLKLEVLSAILLDAETGLPLYELNADQALPPASMAKMMTEYLVMESIESGKIKWDEMVTTTQNAADAVGSGQLLASGEKLSVKDMFAAMSIYSGNDASIALAEHIAGSEEEFAKLANETAKKLGLSKDANFINATGLNRYDMKQYAPKTVQGETMMTARDAAILAYHIIKEHKSVLDFTKIPSQKLRPTDKSPMINWNWMLEGNKDNINFRKYSYQGLDGLKTGHTSEAGYCFTGTAERNGMRLISVVMGTKSEPKRFEETRKLLDYGFNTFEKKQIIAAEAETDVLKTVDVKKGAKTTVPVVTANELSIIVKKGVKDEELVKTAEPKADIVAPIKQGDVVGKLTVTYQEKKYEVDLVAKEDVKKGSWIRLFFRAIKNFFADLFGGIKNLF